MDTEIWLNPEINDAKINVSDHIFFRYDCSISRLNSQLIHFKEDASNPYKLNAVACNIEQQNHGLTAEVVVVFHQGMIFLPNR